MVAVVLLHLLVWAFVPTGAGAGPWGLVSDHFYPVRMPLLFALSGFIVSARIRTGWSDRKVRRRVASSWYLYMVWLVVYAALSLIPASDPLPQRLSGWRTVVTQLVIPDTTLWFVFALGVYVPLLAALRRVHPALVLTALAVLSIEVGRLPAEVGGLWVRIPEYAFYFAFGVHGAPLLSFFTRRALVRKLAVVLALYLVASRAVKLPSLPFEATGAAVVATSTLAVLTLIAAASLVGERWPVLLRPAAAVGRRTLPIFLMHPPMIWVLMSIPGALTLWGLPGAAWAAPAVCTALVVAACLIAHAAMRRTPLRVLFELPARGAGRSADTSAGDRRAAGGGAPTWRPAAGSRG